jgi:Cys-rich four helix bundle protein (predicted Tat secretion target)
MTKGATMDRRNFLKTTTLTAVAMAASQKGFGKDSKATAGTQKTAGTEKLAAVAKASGECFIAAQACIAHCEETFDKGNTMMAQCLKDTLNMSAICEATLKLSGYHNADVDSLKQVISACAKLCRACAESCKEHISHSSACKECKESCERCADACDAYVKA